MNFKSRCRLWVPNLTSFKRCWFIEGADSLLFKVAYVSHPKSLVTSENFGLKGCLDFTSKCVLTIPSEMSGRERGLKFITLGYTI